MVDSDMRFDTFKQFYRKAELIKDRYDEMSLEEKWEYKRYLFSRESVKDFARDKMWEYLNEPKNSIYFVSVRMLGHYINRG